MVESPGLFFIQGIAGRNAYVHHVGDSRMVLVAPDSVDRGVLREAVLAVHATDPPGSVTTAIPGFTTNGATPDGTTFEPEDKTRLPGARNIELHTQGSVAPLRCQYGIDTEDCEIESPSLMYAHYTNNTQVYARIVGSRQVSVVAGMGVDRSVLRTAALTARPATDDELRLVLPTPPPVRDRSLMRAVRGLALDLFGP